MERRSEKSLGGWGQGRGMVRKDFDFSYERGVLEDVDQRAGVTQFPVMDPLGYGLWNSAEQWQDASGRSMRTSQVRHWHQERRCGGWL